MRELLKAQLALPDVTVEVKSYELDRPAERVVESPTFRLSRFLPRMRPKHDMRWRLPSERATRPVSQVWLMAPHSPVVVEGDADSWTSVSCSFAPDRFEEMVAVDHWTDEMTAAFLGVRSPLIEALLDRLAREVMLPREGSATVIEAIITLLTAELGNIARHGEGNRRRSGKFAPWQLERLRKQVNETMQDGTVNVADLAASCSISPRHLVRRFKETTGDTIHGYVRRMRLERAKLMLAADDVMLKDIAAKLGFKTPSHFAAEFRQQLGCSPSQYRARLRSN
jgi:AraC-like DNA-binding protein